MNRAWRVGRILAIFLGSLPAILPYYRPINIDWRVSILISAIISAFIFIWLFFGRKMGKIDYTSGYGMDSPFIPTTRYAISFWIMASQSFILCGILCFLTTLLLSTGKLQLGILFLLLGVSIFGTVWLHLKLFSQKQP